MNLTKSGFKIFVGNIVAALAQFLGIAIFSRQIGAASMGVYFLFLVILNITSIFGDFGLRGAVEKRISEGREPGQFLSSVVLVKLVPVSLLASGVLLFASQLNTYIGAPLAELLVLTIVVREASLLSVFVLRGELRVGETAILKIIRDVGWLIAGWFLLTALGDVTGLVYGLIASEIVALLWGWLKVDTIPRRPTVKHARSLLQYGQFNAISDVGGYVYSWMDVAILGLFVTQTAVGSYEVAWRVTAAVMLLSRSIATTLFPQMSRWDTEDAKARIEELIPRALTPSLALIIPAFFGTLVLSREILTYVFGAEFAIAWLVLIILMGEKLLQGVHIILGRALQAIDRPELAALSTIVSVVLNLILNALFIWQFGIVGAAVATALSFSLNTLLHWYYLRNFVRIQVPYREIGWCTFSSILMAIMVGIIKIIITPNSLLALLVLIGVGALIYGLILLSYGPLRTKAVQTYINLRMTRSQQIG
ncbi:flippase [Natrialbaceae archaeon GCM10025810]|uniref:flippase n=1 Tax=Halovalidus salilacus TaxID=3075124 RepID=UPI003607588B